MLAATFAVLTFAVIALDTRCSLVDPYFFGHTFRYLPSVCDACVTAASRMMF
jgi:hypothetical protein